MNPNWVGDIWVLLGFSSKSEQTEVPERHHVDSGPTKVNERDKKPGVHCAGAV